MDTYGVEVTVVDEDALVVWYRNDTRTARDQLSGVVADRLRDSVRQFATENVQFEMLRIRV